MSEILFTWNNMNHNQKVIFSLIAENIQRTGINFTLGYQGFTDTVIDNIQVYNPNVTKKSMGGLISGLNLTGLTESAPGTTYEGNRHWEEVTLSLSDTGKNLIQNHYDVIENFIEKNRIKCLTY